MVEQYDEKAKYNLECLELLEELKRAANRLSFLNAGEGACYNAQARDDAKANYEKLLAEVKARGVDFDTSGYLI